MRKLGRLVADTLEVNVWNDALRGIDTHGTARNNGAVMVDFLEKRA